MDNLKMAEKTQYLSQSTAVHLLYCLIMDFIHKQKKFLPIKEVGKEEFAKIL